MIPSLPPEQSPAPAIDHGTRNLIIIAVSAGVVALLFGAFTIFRSSRMTPVIPSEESLSSGGSAASVDLEQGLGAAIYENAANPVGDAIPEATSPVANPIDGAYKNPFE